ncbi:hypothetical protein MRX96_046256 [Rhipicephalus microplus]
MALTDVTLSTAPHASSSGLDSSNRCDSPCLFSEPGNSTFATRAWQGRRTDGSFAIGADCRIRLKRCFLECRDHASPPPPLSQMRGNRSNVPFPFCVPPLHLSFALSPVSPRGLPWQVVAKAAADSGLVAARDAAGPARCRF